MRLFNYLYSTTLSLLFIAVFILNTFILKQSIIGLFLLIFYIIWFGSSIGDKFLPEENILQKWWIGVWILLSAIMIVGAISYYIASLPAALFQILVLLTPVLTLWKKKRESFTVWFLKLRHQTHQHLHSISSTVYLAVSVVIIFLVSLIRFFSTNTILESVRSPWDNISPTILILFFVSVLFVFALLYRGREQSLTIPLFSLCLFTLLSLNIFAFPIGAGFDPFIHKATESHLAQFGTITPKPFYYIGQYTVVLFFAHAFSIPIDLIDTFLVPILCALLLPLAWLGAAIHILKKERFALLALVGIFFLPLESFITTTPQSLANLWTLLCILATVPYLMEQDRAKWPFYILGSIATLLIHPISGIPIFIFLFLLAIENKRSVWNPVLYKIVSWFSVFVACLGLPISFITNAYLNHTPISLNTKILDLSLFSNISVFFANRFHPIIDFVYLYGRNLFFIIFLLSFFSFVIYRKELSNRFKILLMTVLILGVNYVLLSVFIDFSFLIDYERMNYASRLIPLMFFFLSPFLILSLNHISVNIRTRPMVLKICLLVLLVGCATASFYFSYPRRDIYETSHAFNVGQSDINAVYMIEDWAQKKPYITLANQSVSAAAIKNIGFRYYNDLFFYPIPTGGTMYQLFLSMNETPNKKIAEQAIQLLPKDSNVKTVFYVVDSYWWDFSRIVESSKAIASDWKSIGDGAVYVFKFDF